MSGYSGNSSARNLLRGLIPTPSVWDTNPSNLENITDGDINTSSGYGSKTLTGAGQVGYLIYDLGALYNFIIGGYVDLYTSAGTVTVVLDGSIDGVSYYNKGTSSLSTTLTTSTPLYLDPQLLLARFIRVRTYLSTAGTANISFHELVANELGV